MNDLNEGKRNKMGEEAEKEVNHSNDSSTNGLLESEIKNGMDNKLPEKTTYYDNDVCEKKENDRVSSDVYPPDENNLSDTGVINGLSKDLCEKKEINGVKNEVCPPAENNVSDTGVNNCLDHDICQMKETKTVNKNVGFPTENITSETDLKNGLDKDLCEKMIEEKNGAELGKMDNNVVTFHEACKQGNFSLVESMLKTSDVNMKDDEGWSCLHETCIHSCQFTRIAKLLLENGADPNIQDNGGETPLHGAVLFHFIDNIKLLVLHKADFTLCNNEGVSPLHIAQMANDDEILTVFGIPSKETKVMKRTTKNSNKRKVINRPKRIASISYIPSPLSSPSILKKRKRSNEDDQDMNSPKKRITFSLSKD